jgi:hypothetical protein
MARFVIWFKIGYNFKCDFLLTHGLVRGELFNFQAAGDFLTIPGLTPLWTEAILRKI